MQKKFFLFLSTALLAVVLFSSCSKSNDEGRYIPANAGAVLHIDGASLGKKLPWAELKANPLFTKLAGDTSVPAFGKAVLENPDNSGIDVNKSLVAFFVDDSSGKYASVQGSVKDEAKFKAFLAAADKEGSESKKDNITYWSGKGTSVGYNKDRFVFTVGTDELMQKDPAMTWGDTTVAMDTTVVEPVMPAKDMNPVTAMLFNLKEDASLAKNEKFSELMKTKGDLHMWFNYEHFSALTDMANMGPAAAMVNIKKLYEGMINMFTLNFEDGKIVIDTKTYAGKELDAIYKKYGGGNIDKAVLNNIPAKDIAGLFAFNFKPEGIRELLKLLGMEGFANLGAGQLGFTLDDFIKANKGEILFSVGDLRADSAAGSKATFLFGAGINDKASFGKLIDAGKKAGAGMNTMAEKIGYGSNDRWFALSNEKTVADAFLAGKGGSSNDIFSTLTGSPMGGYVNFQYIIKTFQPKAGADSSDKAAYDINLAMWDHAVMTGGAYNGGGITGHFEVKLVDKKTNSLKQLNTFSGKMGAMIDGKEKELDALYAPGTVPAPGDSLIAQ